MQAVEACYNARSQQPMIEDTGSAQMADGFCTENPALRDSLYGAVLPCSQDWTAQKMMQKI